MEEVSSWTFHSEKSLLWVYGGHPILPSSALLFAKQLELLKFCESCWPTKTKSLKERSLKPGMVPCTLSLFLELSYYQKQNI